MKNIIINIILASTLLFSCNKSELPTEKGYDIEELSSKKAQEIIEANNEFAFEFFKKVADSEEEANFMVSPVSLSLALGMVYNGAAGDTKLAFDNTLNYNSDLDDVNIFNKNLIGKLSSSSDGSVMEIANSIWIRDGFPVKEDFINLNQENYYAEVSNLNFDDPSAVNTINNWVADKTHDKIPEIVDQITGQTMMFLINALYFNANWKYKFDPEETNKRPFYITDTETVNVDMMYIDDIEDGFEFINNDLFSSVIMPYKKDKFSMVILLPNEDKTCSDILAELNSENWKLWLDSSYPFEMPVSLPKFKSDYKNKLNDELIEMGLSNAFSDYADFSNISDISLKISEVLQKTYIDVNEKGTEAAAVTSITMDATTALPRNFNANKPFIYVIKENFTGSICFIGKLGEPVYE